MPLVKPCACILYRLIKSPILCTLEIYYLSTVLWNSRLMIPSRQKSVPNILAFPTVKGYISFGKHLILKLYTG